MSCPKCGSNLYMFETYERGRRLHKVMKCVYCRYIFIDKSKKVPNKKKRR